MMASYIEACVKTAMAHNCIYTFAGLWGSVVHMVMVNTSYRSRFGKEQMKKSGVICS